MTDRPPLPEVYEALLDAATLGRLFDDLAACARVDEVRLRDGAAVDLDDARRRLAAGSPVGVRIRYNHDGMAWLDTLRPVTGGTRLVRVRDPAPGDPR